MEKNYCPTHHLFYYGQECPLCRHERTQRYVKTFGYVPPADKAKKKEELDREATAEDFEKLLSKFDSITKKHK